MLQLLLAVRINGLNLHSNDSGLELAENSIDSCAAALMSSIPLAPSVNKLESYYRRNYTRQAYHSGKHCPSIAQRYMATV